jgi:hypothetical protein
MLISKNVEISLNVRNISYIREYKKDDSLCLGDQVIIPVDLLSKGSHEKIKCKCEVCGNEKEITYQKYNKNIKNGGYYSCSSRCSQDKVKRTSLIKYGSDYYTKTDEYKKRAKKTNIEKYGSNYYLGSEEGINKTKEAILEKYGVDNPFKSKEIQDKIKSTNIEKWGVDNPSKSEEIKNKISLETSRVWNEKYKRYYKENHNLDIISYKDSIYNIKCSKCNSDYEIHKFLLANRILLNTEICTNCNTLRDGSSGYENELKDYIRSIYSGEIIENSRSIINPYELDIHLPEIGIAIEFNGLYWHSDKYKNKNYHLTKHEMCLEKEIELIQIWQDDWLYKNDIIKSILNKKINNGFKIDSSSCELKAVDGKLASEFLSKNHLKGISKSKINIGLFYKNDMVSIISFNRTRGDKYILTRYCNKLNFNINGSSLRLLSYFKENINFEELVVHHDKSLGFCNYEKLGFKRFRDYKPEFSYIISGIRKNKTKKLDSLKVYDSGKIKFILKGKDLK